MDRLEATLATSLTIVALAAGAPAATLAAAGPEGATVISLVNKQRAANGIPPITTVEQADASWCPNETGAPFTHGETGRVSAPDDAWSIYATPYSTAPLHQYIIYEPLATVAGDVHTANGGDCMGVSTALDFFAPLTTSPPLFYAFVNERGPRYARASEVARELPETPVQELGEPVGTRTGPEILLYVVGLGFSPSVTSVMLKTQSGATVPSVKLDRQVGGGVLVTPPLKPGTAYTLQVAWLGEPQQQIEGFGVTSVPGVAATQSLSFATAPAPKPPAHRRRRKRG
jgi:hypothetical protein